MSDRRVCGDGGDWSECKDMYRCPRYISAWRCDLRSRSAVGSRGDSAPRPARSSEDSTLDIYAHYTEPADQRASDTLANCLDTRR